MRTDSYNWVALLNDKIFLKVCNISFFFNSQDQCRRTVLFVLCKYLLKAEFVDTKEWKAKRVDFSVNEIYINDFISSKLEYFTN